MLLRHSPLSSHKGANGGFRGKAPTPAHLAAHAAHSEREDAESPHFAFSNPLAGGRGGAGAGRGGASAAVAAAAAAKAAAAEEKEGRGKLGKGGSSDEDMGEGAESKSRRAREKRRARKNRGAVAEEEEEKAGEGGGKEGAAQEGNEGSGAAAVEPAPTTPVEKRSEEEEDGDGARTPEGEAEEEEEEEEELPPDELALAVSAEPTAALPGSATEEKGEEKEEEGEGAEPGSASYIKRLMRNLQKKTQGKEYKLPGPSQEQDVSVRYIGLSRIVKSQVGEELFKKEKLARVKDKVPEGFEARVSKSKGAVYYVELATGKTFWTLPGGTPRASPRATKG